MEVSNDFNEEALIAARRCYLASLDTGFDSETRRALAGAARKYLVRAFGFDMCAAAGRGNDTPTGGDDFPGSDAVERPGLRYQEGRLNSPGGRE